MEDQGESVVSVEEPVPVNVAAAIAPDEIKNQIAREMADAEKYRVVEGIDMARVRPMPHHIVVRWLASKETKGGLLLPQNRQRKNRMNGVILAVGPKCMPEIVEAFENGYRVVFDALCEKEWIGSQDPADRDTVFIMREEDVLLTLEVTEVGAGEVVAAGMEASACL